MISISKISKSFMKGQVQAVKEVSFEIKDNEIFALLGPNGAGKTTTMRMLATLIAPTSGNICFDGISTIGNEALVRRKLGFLTNEIRLDGQFTPNELAYYYGQLYGLHRDEVTKNKDRLFSYFGIQEYADRKYDSFSTGMKQKTSIAICLIHDPQIIIFDEPTNGLDVLTQQLIENYIIGLKTEGKCVIISTHILEVVERLADRVGVIIDGKSVFCGTCDEMKAAHSSNTMRGAFIEMYEKNHLKEAPVIESKRLKKGLLG